MQHNKITAFRKQGFNQYSCGIIPLRTKDSRTALFIWALLYASVMMGQIYKLLCLCFSQPEWTKQVPSAGVTQLWAGRRLVIRPQGAAKQHKLWKRVPSRLGLRVWSTKVLTFFSSNSKAALLSSYWHPRAPEAPKGFRRWLICREILSQLQIFGVNFGEIYLPWILPIILQWLKRNRSASKVLRHHKFVYNHKCSKNCSWI